MLLASFFIFLCRFNPILIQKEYNTPLLPCYVWMASQQAECMAKTFRTRDKKSVRKEPSAFVFAHKIKNRYG